MRTAAEPLQTGVIMIRKQGRGIVTELRLNLKNTFRKHPIKAPQMCTIQTAQPLGKLESPISGGGKLAMARIWIEMEMGSLASLRVRLHQKIRVNREWEFDLPDLPDNPLFGRSLSLIDTGMIGLDVAVFSEAIGLTFTKNDVI